MRERDAELDHHLAPAVIVAGGLAASRRALAAMLTEAGYEVAASVNLNELDESLLVFPEALVVAWPHPAPRAEALALSPRERQVIALAAQGLPDKAIADNLAISQRTVRFHLEGARRKLGAHNRTEAVAKAGFGSHFL
jgi:DNA-binding CsgD family transcriptional regulator